MGLAREAARPARRPRCPLCACNSASSVWYQAKSRPPRLATRGRKEACDSTNGWAGSACDRVSAGQPAAHMLDMGTSRLCRYHAARFLHAAALPSSAPDSLRGCVVADGNPSREAMPCSHGRPSGVSTSRELPAASGLLTVRRKEQGNEESPRCGGSRGARPCKQS